MKFFLEKIINMIYLFQSYTTPTELRLVEEVQFSFI